MDDDFFNDAPPHSPQSQASGSPSAPVAEGSFASNDGHSSLSPANNSNIHSTQPPSRPSAPPSSQPAPPPPPPPPSAPWDDDDWGTAAGAPASAPQPPAQNPPPAVPAKQPHSLSSSAAPDHPPSPKTASPVVDDDFFQSSPTAPSEPSEGAPTGPTAPASKPVSSTAYDALQKQIANRTMNIDTATKKKEAEITAAAAEYVKQQKTKREKEVTDAKARHTQEQQEGVKKIDEYRKSGAVWSAVGMLVDLQKPNPYCKSTERMRSVLSTLSATEKPGAAPTTAK